MAEGSRGTSEFQKPGAAVQLIPIQATPNQSVNVLLDTQPCTIVLRQTSTGLFATLYVNDVLVIGGVLVRNANRIVRDAYLGFLGDLIVWDSQPPQGTEGDDPVYTDLGSRFLLIYLEPGDL